MMIKAFVRREGTGAGMRIGAGMRAHYRMERVDEDPTDCIVCVMHIVWCMVLCMILLVTVAELSDKFAFGVQNFLVQNFLY